MNKRNEPNGIPDLVPGMAGVIAFLAVLALLGSGWLWLSALLAVGTYLGVRWILPSPRKAGEVVEEKPVTTREVLSQVAELSRCVPDAGLQRRLRGICDQADSLLRYFDAHPERADESLFVIRQYLQLARTGVQRFVDAGRYAGPSARQSIQNMNELLEQVSSRFGHLQDRLAEEDDASLAGELKVLTQTLKELDTVYMNVKGNDG